MQDSHFVTISTHFTKKNIIYLYSLLGSCYTPKFDT